MSNPLSTTDMHYLEPEVNVLSGSECVILFIVQWEARYRHTLYASCGLETNSTQRASMDAGVKHLNFHIYLVTTI